MVQHVPTKDMPAFMDDNGCQLILSKHLDQTRGDGDGCVGVAKGVGIGHRIHLKIEARLSDA